MIWKINENSESQRTFIHLSTSLFACIKKANHRNEQRTMYRNIGLGGSVRINKLGLLVTSLTTCLLLYYILFGGTTTSARRRIDNQVNLRKLLIGGIQAAQLGGLEVVYAKNNIQAKSKGRTKEGANDPVTNADLRSHCAMERGLKRLFPKVTVISEEEVACDDESHIELDPTVIEEDIHLPDDHLVDADDVTIWIDPLDATQEYTGMNRPKYIVERCSFP